MTSAFSSLSPQSPNAERELYGVCGGTTSSLAALLRRCADGLLSVAEVVEHTGLCRSVVELYLASPLTMACVRLRNV